MTILIINIKHFYKNIKKFFSLNNLKELKIKLYKILISHFAIVFHNITTGSEYQVRWNPKSRQRLPFLNPSFMLIQKRSEQCRRIFAILTAWHKGKGILLIFVKPNVYNIIRRVGGCGGIYYYCSIVRGCSKGLRRRCLVHSFVRAATPNKLQIFDIMEILTLLPCLRRRLCRSCCMQGIYARLKLQLQGAQVNVKEAEVNDVERWIHSAIN